MESIISSTEDGSYKSTIEYGDTFDAAIGYVAPDMSFWLVSRYVQSGESLATPVPTMKSVWGCASVYEDRGVY